MIVAVFGDIHGNLPGMYELCRNWQQDKYEHIDLVLQTGDIGLWRTFDEMDKATKKHFAKDQSELASAAYLSGKRTAPIETWFIHGNHDNFPLLVAKEGQAVDPAGRIIFLATGSVRELRKGNEVLRVAALGGMEYRFGKFPMPSNERVQKYLHPPSLERLQKESPQVDVLLLHDAPLNKGLRNRFPTGSKRLTELIETMQPRFVFYGHYDDPPEPFYLGPTLCVGTNSAGARHIPNRDGAMGILRTNLWQFHFVEP
ncbi:MAG: metallophosphoesterase [Sedimentisphaerales bacterium]